jgi:hypothetical protein
LSTPHLITCSLPGMLGVLTPPLSRALCLLQRLFRLALGLFFGSLCLFARQFRLLMSELSYARRLFANARRANFDFRPQPASALTCVSFDPAPEFFQLSWIEPALGYMPDLTPDLLAKVRKLFQNWAEVGEIQVEG